MTNSDPAPATPPSVPLDPTTDDPTIVTYTGKPLTKQIKTAQKHLQTISGNGRNTYNLSPKRWLFVLHYVWGGHAGNGTQSAIASGFSPNTAGVQASQLLRIPDIKDAVASESAKRDSRLEASRGEVMLEIQALAFSNMADYGTFDGNGDFILHDSAQLPRKVMAAVKEVHKDEVFNKDGDLVRIRTRLVLHDKISSLRMLGTIKVDELRDKGKASSVQVNVAANNAVVGIVQVLDEYGTALEDAVTVAKTTPSRKPTRMDIQDATKLIPAPSNGNGNGNR